ncbi:MAG: phenylalanine--tRNA ligase subunit alpha [Candidatus Portnoybacteria bacterium]|nr:phenylalanine--tRNA ligase subunit alpha [Candidatus Portnoybacteria bacterium]
MFEMLKQLKEAVLKEIEAAKNINSLEDLRIRYFGRKGKITEVLRKLKDLSQEERINIGASANQLKQELELILEQKKKDLGASFEAAREWIDISAPGHKLPRGHLHPRTQVLRKIEEIFQSLGFSVVWGPELETDFYNFEALNVPKDHPARDMQDTFYVDEQMLLRTQTSPMQVRYMEKHEPPLRIIVPGKVFRRDATDASHDCQFYQIEGLMVDKEISVANFKAVIQEFFKRFYGQDTKIRLRPSFFPFTEPSFEVDMVCAVCGGHGCRVCGQTGWLEMMGAGMVHPFVFKSAGYISGQWQGFAFGMGLDRLVMMKYRINDIRLLNSGDLRFLKQF